MTVARLAEVYSDMFLAVVSPQNRMSGLEIQKWLTHSLPL